MKVLITPFIQNKKADWTYWLSENLIALFTSNGFDCAVCTDQEHIFHHGAVYPGVEVDNPILFGSRGRTYEEYLYRFGASNKDYLFDDVENILQAIEKYNPNLIISIDRPSGIIAGRYANIPSYTIVNSAMYKNVSFPKKTMAGVNACLSYYGFEQELNLKGLYAHCDRRIGFGPVEADPFLNKYHVDRVGMMSVYPAKKGQTNRVCVFLTETKKPAFLLKKIIKDAFLGAPYAINAWYPNAKPETEGNIRIHSYIKPESIPGCIAVIHDGNPYIANRCMALGIPQLVIASHTYLRNDIALASERNKFGTFLYEDSLAMSSLYETYRKMLTDDAYYDGCQKMKREILEYGDLSEILNLTASI